MERYVDHQVRATEEIDDKSEQLLALAVALFGGMLAYVGFSQGSPGSALRIQLLQPVFLMPFVLGLYINVVSFLIILDGYMGLTASRAPKLTVAPEPDWLLEKLKEPWWTLEHHFHATLQGYSVWSKENERLLSRLGKLRRKGLYYLLIASVLYATAIFIRLLV